MSDSGKILPVGKLPGSLLERLIKQYPLDHDRLLIGPGLGRDSAAISFGDSVLVIKTDPITFPTDRAAFHLIHINANDIACQGATPRWLVVTALLPHDTTTERMVEELFDELNTAAASIGVAVIGGHTEVTLGLDRPLLIGTMFGETSADRLISPDRAKPGDRLLMTRTSGIEGTAILGQAMVNDDRFDPVMLERARKFIDSPGISILPEAIALTRAEAVTALHDPTEGGIASAAREMALAAGCGTLISRDAIPVAEETALFASILGIDPIGLLASGSLIAAVPKDRMHLAEDALARAGIPFSWIGKLTPIESGLRLRTGLADSGLPDFAIDEIARILSTGD